MQAGGGKASAEEVLRPESRYPPYEDDADLRRAYKREELVPLERRLTGQLSGRLLEERTGSGIARRRDPRRGEPIVVPSGLATL